MKREGILYVLRKLEAQNILPRSKNVQLSCMVAKWRRAHKGGTDRHPSMGVSVNPSGPSKVNCFACKWHGSLEALVAELLMHGAISEALSLHLGAYIAELEEVPLEELVAALEEYEVADEVVEDKVFPEDVLEPYSKSTHRYMVEDRGFSLETLRAWGSGFDASSGRVTFPVRNWRGYLVGMVGRGVHEDIIPTYKNYWKFSKGRYLYGEDKIGRDTTLVVVEGPLDTLAVWQALVEESLLDRYSVVGVFGADATVIQVRKIVQLADDVVLWMDNDSTGWDATDKIGRALQDQLLVRRVRYPDAVGGDPDELLSEGVPAGLMLEEAGLFAAPSPKRRGYSGGEC